MTERRRNKRTPKLRHHRGSGQGFVELSGRRIYLGVYGREETERKYHRLIAEFLAAGRTLPAAPDQIMVLELLARFWRHCIEYYRHPDGSPTDEVSSFRLALRPLRELYGDTPVAEFSPRRLKSLRQAWIDQGHCRTHINRQTHRVRHVFKWGVQEELVDPAVLAALGAVPGLKRGRTAARESEPVRPVPDEWVSAIEPFVSRQVWALVRLQQLTAARPSELLRMRPRDLDRSDEVWQFRPTHHKNAHRGHERVIYFGPRAQLVLRSFLHGRPADAFLFSPIEAEAERVARRSARRTTPPAYGNRPGKSRVRSPKRAPRETYDRDSYRRAIQRACQKAGVPRWSPHQLRHSRATSVRRKYGLEGAQTILGQRRVEATQIYAEASHARAIEIAKDAG